jgi:dTMP kinase
MAIPGIPAHRHVVPPTGKFITFEGPEGAGKTTQVERLTRRLEGAGVAVMPTREPGGTVVGRELRAMLLVPERPPLATRAAALLLSTDRAQHVDEVIRPALMAGMIVISDRYTDSMLAHQGYGSGLDLDALRWLGQFATDGLKPDLTFLLDIDPQQGLERRRIAFQIGEGEYNRIDQQNLAYHQRVRQGFLDLAQREPARFRVVDATHAEDQVASQIWARITKLLGLSDLQPRP